MSLRRAVQVCIRALADYEEREESEGEESVVVAEALLKLLREKEGKSERERRDRCG